MIGYAFLPIGLLEHVAAYKKWEARAMQNKIQKQHDFVIGNNPTVSVTATSAGYGEMKINTLWHERGEFPPAGTECEVLNNELSGVKWEKCTILFMGKFKCIYSSESCSERVGNVDLTGAVEFRPLRTEREKAIDEMIAAIDHIKEGGFETFIGALYDAGFRKQE